MKWINNLQLRIIKKYNEFTKIQRNNGLLIILLLLVFGLIDNCILAYQENEIFELIIFSVLISVLLLIITLLIMENFDLKAKDVIINYEKIVEVHKTDKNWLTQELFNEQQACHNKIGKIMHQRKKDLLEKYIKNLDVLDQKDSTIEKDNKIDETIKGLTEKINKTHIEFDCKINEIEDQIEKIHIIPQQYFDTLSSNDKPEENTKRLIILLFIYNYIDSELNGTFKYNELNYLKFHVFESIYDKEIKYQIEEPISFTKGLQKPDFYILLHNLYIMCKSANNSLKKKGFYDNLKKYIDLKECTIDSLYSNSERKKIGNKIIYIDMKTDNFFTKFLKINRDSHLIP